MWIKVIDSRGALKSYDSEEYVALEHMLLVEGNQLFGADNLHRRFSDNEWRMFIGLITTLPIGTYGDFTWERQPDGRPTSAS